MEGTEYNTIVPAYIKSVGNLIKPLAYYSRKRPRSCNGYRNHLNFGDCGKRRTLFVGQEGCVQQGQSYRQAATSMWVDVVSLSLPHITSVGLEKP